MDGDKLIDVSVTVMVLSNDDACINGALQKRNSRIMRRKSYQILIFMNKQSLKSEISSETFQCFSCITSNLTTDSSDLDQRKGFEVHGG